MQNKIQSSRLKFHSLQKRQRFHSKYNQPSKFGHIGSLGDLGTNAQLP